MPPIPPFRGSVSNLLKRQAETLVLQSSRSRFYKFGKLPVFRQRETVAVVLFTAPNACLESNKRNKSFGIMLAFPHHPDGKNNHQNPKYHAYNANDNTTTRHRRQVILLLRRSRPRNGFTVPR